MVFKDLAPKTYTALLPRSAQSFLEISPARARARIIRAGSIPRRATGGPLHQGAPQRAAGASPVPLHYIPGPGHGAGGGGDPHGQEAEAVPLQDDTRTRAPALLEDGGPLPRPAPSGRCRRAAGAPDPLHAGADHQHPGPLPGAADHHAQGPGDGPGQPRNGPKGPAPAQSGKAPGPTRGPTEGGGPLPRPAPSGRCRRAGGAPDPLQGGPLHNHKKGGMLWQTM